MIILRTKIFRRAISDEAFRDECNRREALYHSLNNLPGQPLKYERELNESPIFLPTYQRNGKLKIKTTPKVHTRRGEIGKRLINKNNENINLMQSLPFGRRLFKSSINRLNEQSNRIKQDISHGIKSDQK